MDAVKLQELKKRHGELYEVEYGEQKFYFRKPTRQAFKRYYDKLVESIYDAACILCLDLIIEPSSEEFARVIESDPGLPIKIVGRLTDFFGSVTIQLKKI